MIIIDRLPIIQQFLQIGSQILFCFQQMQILRFILLHFDEISLYGLFFQSYYLSIYIGCLQTLNVSEIGVEESGKEQTGFGDLVCHKLQVYIILYQLSLIILMTDSERRQKLFYGRVELQLREIQHINREIIAFSKQMSQCSNDISESEVNTRKMQFIKTQIKEKLREFASNIDEVCKILDRKIILIIKEITKEQSNSTNKTTSKMNNFNSNARINGQQEEIIIERAFSDTLNPHITRLQAKIVEHQNREIILNKKIEELSGKNQILLEEFNRLSDASNKKINQLNTELIHRTSFSSDNDYYGISHTKTLNKIIPSPSKQKRSSNVFFETDQQSYSQTFDPSFSGQITKRQEKNRGLSFGCMPKNNTTGRGILNFSGLSQQCQKLDKNDRNRRFDLLLNKLRDSQQNSTEMSSYEQPKAIPNQQASVFSQKVIKRYQI